MKRFITCCLLLPLSINSIRCGSIMGRFKHGFATMDKPKSHDIYIYPGLHLLAETKFQHFDLPSTALIIWLYTLDVPISLVADTIMMPFDIEYDLSERP